MELTNVLATFFDPVFLLRAFYLASSAFILLIQAVPALRSRFLAYGSRATAPAATGIPPKKRPGVSSAFEQLLDCLATWQVPHTYFRHFYIVSCLSSLFWAWKLDIMGKNSFSLSSIQAAWMLMVLQGGRRLMECYFFMSPSKSRMWIGHWVLGVLFYLTINVAIWIEDAATSTNHAMGKGPWKQNILPWLAIPLVACQHLQCKIHAYFHRLRTTSTTYQLPSYRPYSWFPDLLCPHYTCEVCIYFLLAFVAAPAGRVVNWSVLAATVLVAVNLGVTASGTKVWYEKRFGVEKVRYRKRMVPWVW